MLILCRKVGERVMISEGIVITVQRIERGRVFLGFEAPKDTSIDREEVYDRKRKEGIEHAEGR